MITGDIILERRQILYTEVGSDQTIDVVVEC